jgi:ATP-dependent DNA helicase RecQ
MREWRRTVAKGKGVPAYVILHDRTLEEICLHRPSTIGELLEISGIGARKAEFYRREILSLLAAFSGTR